MNARSSLSTTALTACTPPGQGEATGALILYGNSFSDGRGDWLRREAETAGFTIEMVELGGGDALNRLVAEKNNPLGDVVIGLNNVYFERLKVEGVLEPYTPAWSGEVDAALGDGADGHFWPIVGEPIMLVYNTEAYDSPDEAPQDWPDLWTDPRFHDRYEVQPGLGGATTQMVVTGILSRHLDPQGDLGVSAEGWAAIEQYYAHGSPSVQGTDLYARMKDGQVDAGQMWLAGKKAREQQYGVTSEAAQPEVGVPYVVQHTALVKGSPRAERARAFINWFGSAEIQGRWSSEFFTAPTNERATEWADPEAIEFTNSFTRQDIDWTLVAENLGGWVEKIELEYVRA